MIAELQRAPGDGLVPMSAYPDDPPAMTLTRSHRRFIVGLLLCAAVLGAAFAAAVAYDHARRDRLAPGIRIGGVEVGGLTVTAARTRLQHRAVEARRRALHVRVAGRSFTLPAAAAA